MQTCEFLTLDFKMSGHTYCPNCAVLISLQVVKDFVFLMINQWKINL